MLYELRLYHAVPGRLDDVAARMRDDIPALFDTHGFPRPGGGWTVSSGRGMPMYVYLLKWPDTAVRAKAFASLYTDAAWAKLRDRTNGPREMVLKYEVLFMQAAPAWEAARQLHSDRDGPADGVHELSIIDLLPGQTGAANTALSQTDLPALRDAGCTTLGVFDLIAGAPMPSLVMLTRWDSEAARKEGLRRYEQTDAVMSARTDEADRLKAHLLGRRDTWLLEPTAFNPPNYHCA